MPESTKYKQFRVDITDTREKRREKRFSLIKKRGPVFYAYLGPAQVEEPSARHNRVENYPLGGGEQGWIGGKRAERREGRKRGGGREGHE